MCSLFCFKDQTSFFEFTPLYGLYHRMSLSRKNGWLDKENKVYIIYQINEIQENLGFSKKKAIDYLAELEKFGLVEKKRRGLGLPSRQNENNARWQ